MPFPFRIIENAFVPELIRAANAEWPDSRWPWWHVYDNPQSQKMASKDLEHLPPACAALLQDMARLPVGNFFGDPNVFPDLTLHGAGLHAIAPGGYLQAHLDSDHHPTLGWKREISGILFLNDTWEKSWGGALQLLDQHGQICEEFFPLSNRLVLFQCGNTSWHQVQPVQCPPGIVRKTLAMFWWSQRECSRHRATAEFRPKETPCAAECATVTP